MTDAREYRDLAGECLKWAQETKDDAQREAFLEMANSWVLAAAMLDGKPPTSREAAMSPSRRDG